MIDSRTQRAHRAGIPVEYRADQVEFWDLLERWSPGFSDYFPDVAYRIAPGIEVRIIVGVSETEWHPPEHWNYPQSGCTERYEWRPVEAKPAEPIRPGIIAGYVYIEDGRLKFFDTGDTVTPEIRDRAKAVVYARDADAEPAAQPASEPARDGERLRDALSLGRDAAEEVLNTETVNNTNPQGELRDYRGRVAYAKAALATINLAIERLATESAVPADAGPNRTTLSKPELCQRLANMTRWLELNQKDVFSRGLWDAIFDDDALASQKAPLQDSET